MSRHQGPAPLKPARIALLVLLGCALSGCVMYPIYKTLQPGSQMIVLDEGDAPIEGARVRLSTDFNPHGSLTHEIKLTDARGIAVFEQRSEWQTESWFMHGTRYYNWYWCVQRPGFRTYITSWGSGNTFQPQATVHLARGPSLDCEQTAKESNEAARARRR